MFSWIQIPWWSSSTDATTVASTPVNNTLITDTAPINPNFRSNLENLFEKRFVKNQYLGPARNAPNEGINIKQTLSQKVAKIIIVTEQDVQNTLYNLRKTVILPKIIEKPPLAKELDNVVSKGYKNYFQERKSIKAAIKNEDASSEINVENIQLEIKVENVSSEIETKLSQPLSNAETDISEHLLNAEVDILESLANTNTETDISNSYNSYNSSDSSDSSDSKDLNFEAELLFKSLESYPEEIILNESVKLSFAELIELKDYSADVNLDLYLENEVKQKEDMNAILDQLLKELSL